MRMENRGSSELILASKSPRRQYLLEQAGLSFKVRPSHVDESTVTFSTPEGYVKTLARAKATEISNAHPESWVIGADTIVMIGDQVLGKPKNRHAARQMLMDLSGRSHFVFTGFCICRKRGGALFSETVKTEVVFKQLSDEEIEWYIRTDEPFDKAGAYAIQGLGTFLVRRINGSYTNVVGLPVCEVIEILIQNNIVGLNGSRRDG